MSDKPDRDLELSRRQLLAILGASATVSGGAYLVSRRLTDTEDPEREIPDPEIERIPTEEIPPEREKPEPPDPEPDGENIVDYGAESNPDDPDVDVAETNLDALRDAADAAGEDGAIYVPAGTYYFGHDGSRESILNLYGRHQPAGISIIGDGPAESTLAISEHIPDYINHSGFVWSDHADHDSVEIRDITLDGNYENLGNLAGLGTGSIAVNIQNGETVELHNVHIRGWYTNGVILTGPGGSATNCTFEESGIGVMQDTHRPDERGSGGQHLAPRPDDDKTFTIENCHFNRSSASAINIGRNDGHIVVQNCYIESTGVGGFKLSAGDVVEIRNTYVRPHTQWVEESLPDRFDGRWLAHKFDERGERTLTLILEDVEVRDCTMYGLNISGDGPPMELAGDKIAFHNIARAENRDAVVRSNHGGEYRNVDVRRLSVQDADGTVFDTKTSSGVVDTLRHSGTRGLGNHGNIVINSNGESGDHFQPDVPSRDEVGINAL